MCVGFDMESSICSQPASCVILYCSKRFFWLHIDAASFINYILLILLLCIPCQ